ncbi:MAG TPA: HAD-IB family hydrolase [Pseudolabrys sp.]|nr:HAD-IB family hydrolase [Pseudolabrys sp.]
MDQLAANRDFRLAQVTADSTMPSAAAIFDLDGTVTRGDTFVAFLVCVLKKEPWRLLRCLRLPYKTAMSALGRIPNDDLKVAFLSAILKGVSRNKIERYAVEFAEKCARDMVKPAALAKINWHRARKHWLILASASVDLYVPLLAGLLGFDQTVCTQVEWAEGRLTGRLLGANLRGVAKLDAVRTILGKGRGQTIFAYSDSHLDFPLLAFADHGVAVDADPILLRQAPGSGIVTEFW